MNLRPMHTPLRCFESKADALRAPLAAEDKLGTKWCLYLTPADWRFLWVPNASDVPGFGSR